MGGFDKGLINDLLIEGGYIFRYLEIAFLALGEFDSVILVDHKLSKGALYYHFSYIFASDFLTWRLFGGDLHQMFGQLFIFCHIFSEYFVSIDEDNDPLLDDVGIKRVLLIVKKRLEYLMEGADSIAS